MANTVDKVLKIAEAEVGYLEKKNGDLNYLYDKTANAGDKNYTKYGYEMHQVYPTVMDYPAFWCDCFVDWCFYKAYGITTAKSLLGGNFDDYTVASATMYQKKNALDTTPSVGAQVFFTKNGKVSGCHHTGIVTEVTNTVFKTIEGNTSAGNTVVRNGGGVAKKQYNIASYKGKVLFGHPKYDQNISTTTSVSKTSYPNKWIDVSAYNANMNYQAIKDTGVGNVIIKFIRKDLNPDKLFVTHVNGFNSVGYKCDQFYTYLYTANLNEVKTHTAKSISILTSFKGSTVWLDVEDKVLMGLGEKLINIINAEYDAFVGAGFKCGLYTGLSFWNSYLKQYASKLKPTEIWMARYPSTKEISLSENPVASKKPLNNIYAWQYSSTLRIPSAYNGNLDVSLVYGDSVAKSSVIGTATVDTKVLTVRSGPGTTNKAVGYLAQNSVVVIYEKDSAGSWARIGDNQWVSMKYLYMLGQ